MRAGVLRAGTVLVLLGCLWPAAASAAGETSVTLFGERGEWISYNEAHVWMPPSATIQATGDASHVQVWVNWHGADNYELEFAAPAGMTLEPGVYDRAQRAVGEELGRPGIEVSGDGRGCSLGGRFEVKDIDADDQGVHRLWIEYEQFCGGSPEIIGAFGEVRFNEPSPTSGVAAVPSFVRWSPSDAGRPAPTVPVTVVADEAATLSGASIVGAGADSFGVDDDVCAGRTLAAGERCTVTVSYDRSAPGTRVATLRLPTSAGTIEVPLQAFAYGGVTRLTFHSEPGEYVGQGEDLTYTPATARIFANVFDDGMAGGLNDFDDNVWRLELASAPGEPFGPGTYTGAKRTPFRGSSPGIDFHGNGRGCSMDDGQFTVTEATRDQDGRTRTFAASFEQYCDGQPQALRGELDFRAGDTTPHAPWITGLGFPQAEPPGEQPPGEEQPPADPASPEAGAPASAPALTPAWPAPPESPPPPPATAPSQAAPPSAAAAPPSCRSGLALTIHAMHGTPHRDRLRGTRGRDAISARKGRDRVAARGGSDCVFGGRGADRLRGGAGNDLVVGGPGRDTIDCGRGRDVAVVTRGDHTRRCERVVRAGA